MFFVLFCELFFNCLYILCFGWFPSFVCFCVLFQISFHVFTLFFVLFRFLLVFPSVCPVFFYFPLSFSFFLFLFAGHCEQHSFLSSSTTAVEAREANSHKSQKPTKKPPRANKEAKALKKNKSHQKKQRKQQTIRRNTSSVYLGLNDNTSPTGAVWIDPPKERPRVQVRRTRYVD